MNIRIFVKKISEPIKKTEWVVSYGKYVLYNDTYTYGTETIIGKFKFIEMKTLSKDTLKGYKEIQPSELVFDNSIKKFLESVLTMDFGEIFSTQEINLVNPSYRIMMPDIIEEESVARISSKKREERRVMFRLLKIEIEDVIKNTM